MSKAVDDGRGRLFRVLLLFFSCVIALGGLIYSVYGQRQRTSLRVGEASPQTFVAPVDIQVIDRIATERERISARAQIQTVFTSDQALQQLVLSAVASAGLPAKVQDFLIAAYENPHGVTEEGLEELIQQAVALAPAERQREVKLLLERKLLATSIPNAALTEAARDAAAAAIKPVMTSLRANQIIVREGEILTADDLRVLEILGLYSARSEVVSQTLWILVGCLLLGTLLSFPLLYAADLLDERLGFAQLSFLIFLSLATLIIQRLAIFASTSFLFTPVVPLLVAVLVGDFTALLWAVWISLVTALLIPTAPLFTLVTVLTGAVVASLLAKAYTSRTSLLIAGSAGGLVSAMALPSLALTAGALTPLTSLTSSLLYLSGGILAGIIALGLLPIAESLFGFLTDFRLLELSNPTSPLLQKLLLEAPGSYQHSLIISNLVEQAVKNIGGNALLARVGALYHDVGKLKRPQFFTENQFSGENLHDSIIPHLSYLIITSHVRDGVELLRSFKLPRALEPFVTEHHGTTVLSYFYKRALEDSASVNELNFRYPGPKPRSRETAILMLADAVESASRTLSEPSQGSIRAMIDRLIAQRLQDEQLSGSPLNFHDLEVIANTFERMLTAILHRRISYPTPEEIRGLKRGRDNRRNEALPAS